MSLLDSTKSSVSQATTFINKLTADLLIPFSYGEKDFEYFLIQELEGPKKEVYLRGNQLPHDSLPFGGKQRIVKEFYSGYTEPVMHILGPQESDSIIKGKLKDKRFPIGGHGVSMEIQKLIDSIRIRGNLCRFVMGEWERYGFIEEVDFRVFRTTEIEYEIKLSVSGFTAPQNAKFLEKDRLVPFDINEALIAEADKFLKLGLDYPDGIPFSILRLFNSLIGAIAGAINALTSFVDGIIKAIGDIKKTINRAISLIRHTKNKIAQYVSFVSNFSFNDLDYSSLTSRYDMGKYTAGQVSGSASMYSLLNKFEGRFKNILAENPLDSHMVVTDDTLQSIAIKYYNDSAQWKKIYDYNDLYTTQLETGTVLDIPELG